jgi:hypothetical protein
MLNCASHDGIGEHIVPFGWLCLFQGIRQFGSRR